MKLLAVAGFLVFIVCIEARTSIVQASTRLSFVTDFQNHEPFPYVSVTGDVTELPHPILDSAVSSLTSHLDAKKFLKSLKMGIVCEIELVFYRMQQ